LRRIITEGAAIEEIRNAAKDQEMVTLMNDGLHKVIEGITTVQEVMRETVAY